MLKILVIGAGFAGVWSAASATRVIEEAGQGKQVQVTVVAPHDDIVIRPAVRWLLRILPVLSTYLTWIPCPLRPGCTHILVP